MHSPARTDFRLSYVQNRSRRARPARRSPVAALVSLAIAWLCSGCPAPDPQDAGCRGDGQTCPSGSTCSATGLCVPVDDVPWVDRIDVPAMQDIVDTIDATRDGSDGDAPTMDGPAGDARDASDAGDAADATDSGDVVIRDGGLCAATRGIEAVNVGFGEPRVASGTSVLDSASCQPSTRGPEYVFAVNIPAATGLLAYTVEGTTSFDTVLSVVRGTMCPTMAGSATIACNDNHAGGLTSLVRSRVTAGDHLLIVDQFGMSGSGGPFDLRIETYTPADNDSCSATTATLLTPGTPVMGAMRSGGAAPIRCRFTHDGPQLFYRVDVPAGRSMNFQLTATGTWSPVLRLLDACDAVRCAADALPSAGMMSASHLLPSAPMARTLYVSVGAQSDPVPVGAMFTLSATQM